MENILNDLNSSISTKNEQGIIKNLNLIIDKGGDLKLKEVNTFSKLLNWESKDVLTVVAETIAETCKLSENRSLFTSEEIINRLMGLLSSDSPELIFSTIRALGNICFNNEQASDLIEKAGLDSILSLLRNDSSRENDSITTKASGLLVNLLSTHENIAKSVLKGGILPILSRLLSKYKSVKESNHNLQLLLLTILQALTECFDDKEYVFDESLGKTVCEIFKTSETPEISVLCLEIVHSLAEKEEVKNLLAKEGFCEMLYDLIEKYRDKINDEDGRSVLKMACDLIVLILTGDSCMDLLYSDGKGKTYENMLVWLDSDDLDLLSTGILAIGNFARKDSNCIQMVKNGVVRKLIQILKKYNESTELEYVKVQHALLSTLKNLVIPKENKEVAVKCDIIDVLYPMLSQERYMVVFKLLGTIRMVIDGQPEAAQKLLSKTDFVERLVYWCYHSDHLGVRGEVPRIFSWLIRNAQSSQHFYQFISINDSVKTIVEMISSNHGVMQNESFISLNILAVGLNQLQLNSFYETLCEAEVGKNLSFVLNKYGDKWEKCTIQNCLTLLEQLTKSHRLIKELFGSGVIDGLEKLKHNVNAQDCLDKANKISNLIKDN